MNCSKCNNPIMEGDRFCAVCGTPTPQTEASLPGGKKRDARAAVPYLKKFVQPILIVAVLVVAAGVAWNVLKPLDYLKPSNYRWPSGESYVAMEDGDVVVHTADNGKTVIEGDYSFFFGPFSNYDGTKFAGIVTDSSENGHSGSLYLVGDETTLVADRVERQFEISREGNSVVFIRNLNVENGYGELCLYRDGKTVTLEPEYPLYLYGLLGELSPDGKTLGYTVANGSAEVRREAFIGYVYDGTKHALGDDSIVDAVADDAEYIYYRQNDNLYVQKGFDSETRVNLGSAASLAYVNMDMSEMVYQQMEKMYLSRNGEAGQELEGGIFYFLIPRGVEDDVPAVGVSSFANTFYVDLEMNIRRIDSKFEASGVVARGINSYFNSYSARSFDSYSAREIRNSVARGTNRGIIDSAVLASDGKTITYHKGDGVYQIDGFNPDDSEEELVDDDVIAFVALDDGSAIYYVNEDGELYYQEGKDEPVLVDNDLPTDLQDIDMALFKDNTLFYLSDRELCVSNGGRGSSVDGVEGGDYSIDATPFSVFVSTLYLDDEEVLMRSYRSIDGKTFE